MTPHRPRPDADPRGKPTTIIVALALLFDLEYWADAEPRTLLKVLRLMIQTVRDPLRGTGKPEPLKHYLRGFWSRRITDEHRLVYRLLGNGNEIEFAKARGHYD